MSDKQVPTYPANAAHMMRTTQLAQLQLSAMADTKASILLGATCVIFTIVLGKGHETETPPLPLLIMGGFAFLSAIFAVLAVLPSTRRSRPDAEANLLFFGVFTQLDEDDFIDRVTSRLHSDDSIYRTMARDIHQAGTVLQKKKYRMLAFAYRTFLAGLVTSCAAYIFLYLR